MPLIGCSAFDKFKSRGAGDLFLQIHNLFVVKYLKCFSFSDQNPTPGPGGDTHVEFDEENDELLSFYFGNCIESM